MPWSQPRQCHSDHRLLWKLSLFVSAVTEPVFSEDPSLPCISESEERFLSDYALSFLL